MESKNAISVYIGNKRNTTEICGISLIFSILIRNIGSDRSDFPYPLIQKCDPVPVQQR